MLHVGRREPPSYGSMLSTLIPILLAMVYFFIALGAKDFLWFWPFFEGEPRQITVHCYGEDHILNPGMSEYGIVNEAVNEFLSGKKHWESIGLSDETIEEFRSGEAQLSLEMNYFPTVRIHSFYRYLNQIDTIMIPLDGRHASRNFVFGLTNEIPSAGALSYDDNTPLIQAVVQQSSCEVVSTALE